jgi:U3 small nucleolar RNA-associated protein 21
VSERGLGRYAGGERAAYRHTRSPPWLTRLGGRAAGRERNKPIQPPAAPKQAPFFLPTLPGLEPVFAPEGPPEPAGDGGDAAGASKLIDLSALRPATKFVRLLRRAAAAGGGDYEGCLAHLEGLGPAAVDLEIRSLSAADGGRELGLFADMLAHGLASRRRFELVQACLAAFLRAHDDALRALPAVRGRLAGLAAAQGQAWVGLQGRFQEVLCLVSAFAKMQ